MKSIMAFILGGVFVCNLCWAGDKVDLGDQTARDSYALGYQFGDTLRQRNLNVSQDSLAAGIKDALSNAQPQMSAEDISATLLDLNKRVLAARQLKRKQSAEKNRLEGAAFLAENAKKEGVITLPSGLQYEVIKEGTGKTPQATDTVVVNYRGTEVDGREFDSSYRKGKPAAFRVNGVIPGWTEALQLMKEGAKWKLFIPENLAYGERGPLADKTLIFEVELISVQPPK